MKREGRQHGMVRTYHILPSPLNPRPSTRFVIDFDSPPTAGLFTKVSSKPTNHSKFTGKCGRPRCTGCHMHPTCKSKDKTKGTQKVKSNDVVSNHRLVTWRVVEGQQGLNFARYSATGILEQLSSCGVDDDDDETNGYDRDVNDYDRPYGDGDVDQVVGFQRIKTKTQILNDDGKGNGEDDDDDAMSFCNVAFALDQVEEEDEDWCLVGEM
ncbi:hypothetical protein FNV43_RR14210 [Rhamnella rubrinervis]|uniref:Uncharacterized protein n=1 Tax=Rhamnella rubrinervis TaxID=2594499 RepID=A0A8K0MG79_9ROSA|nr:hypothetical protein FNV43_RR14210 [Rhamnella rubrinervis]